MVRDPLDRVNTGDNTPAMIYYDIVPGREVKLTVAPKGFGSENMSAIKMLKRTAYGFLDFDYFRLKILARLPGRGYARSTLLYGRLNRSLAVTKAGLFECCFHTNPR